MISSDPGGFESAVEVFDDGERTRTSSDHNPEGYLCYNSGGIVSATLEDSARPSVSAANPQSGTADDYEKMARRFIAYAGTFDVDIGNETVTHHVDVSLFPIGGGDDQFKRSASRTGRLSIIASDRVSADRWRPFTAS